MPFLDLRFDWSKAEDRKKFVDDLNSSRKKQASWTLRAKVVWFVQLILSQFLIVVVLYGSVAYIITRYVIILKLLISDVLLSKCTSIEHEHDFHFLCLWMTIFPIFTILGEKLEHFPWFHKKLLKLLEMGLNKISQFRSEMIRDSMKC